MGDDAQRARRRAHNAHALERCNAMGRTAGSVLWQPLRTQDGKWFMPDGSQLSEPPIEWRSERLSTILDEMDAIQAVAPVPDPCKAYVETLDVEKWKAETSAQFVDGAARLHVYKAGEEIDMGQPVFVGHDGMLHAAGSPEPHVAAEEHPTCGISLAVEHGNLLVTDTVTDLGFVVTQEEFRDGVYVTSIPERWAELMRRRKDDGLGAPENPAV